MTAKKMFLAFALAVATLLLPLGAVSAMASEQLLSEGRPVTSSDGGNYAMSLFPRLHSTL